MAALDDAPSLRQREWKRGEPGEETSQQYTSIGGCLMPTTPMHEDTRITPERSLTSPPAIADREQNSQLPDEGLLGTSLETAYMEIPDTRTKTVLDEMTRETPRIIQRTKEASRKEAIASTRQFFATVDRRNTNVSVRGPTNIVTEVRGREVIEVPNVSTTTTPAVLDVEPRGTSSPSN